MGVILSLVFTKICDWKKLLLKKLLLKNLLLGNSVRRGNELVRGPQWSDEEEALLLQGVRTHGTRWRVISDRVLPSRTPSALHKRWLG